MTNWDDPFAPKNSNSGDPSWSPPGPGSDPWSSALVPYPAGDRRSRLAAGLFGIFLGGLGIHSFYLGDTRKGVIQIVVTILTCGVGALWGFVEGIMILAGSVNTDARGVPLDK